MLPPTVAGKLFTRLKGHFGNVKNIPLLVQNTEFEDSSKITIGIPILHNIKEILQDVFDLVWDHLLLGVYNSKANAREELDKRLLVVMSANKNTGMWNGENYRKMFSR